MCYDVNLSANTTMLFLSLLRNNCKILVVRNLMLYCSPSHSWVNEMAKYYHMDWLFILDADSSVSHVIAIKIGYIDIATY